MVRNLYSWWRKLSRISAFALRLLTDYSLTLVLLGSIVATTTAGFNHIAIQVIRIVATATIRPRTRGMGLSMDSALSLSSTASCSAVSSFVVVLWEKGSANHREEWAVLLVSASLLSYLRHPNKELVTILFQFRVKSDTADTPTMCATFIKRKEIWDSNQCPWTMLRIQRFFSSISV